MRGIGSNKHRRCCVSRHIFNTNTIHNCMQLKQRFLDNVPNEIKMCRICASNVSCGSGEMVSGATGGSLVRGGITNLLSVQRHCYLRLVTSLLFTTCYVIVVYDLLRHCC